LRYLVNHRQELGDLLLIECRLVGGVSTMSGLEAPLPGTLFLFYQAFSFSRQV
jgi:hypothetical protein